SSQPDLTLCSDAYFVSPLALAHDGYTVRPHSYRGLTALVSLSLAVSGGGSRLPDITVMSPHFHKSKLCFFTAARGHHADIGGKTAGSMPPEATHISDEGILIDATLIAENGRFLDDAALSTLNSTDFPARNLPV
ncbi:MAG: hydantoinase B/oxoprolinase family protein, partial [Candidatus Polarisedimenticolaceae bacterium]|nr:hydantoinase B/oxoprolinase family protein [Candidatus Polarisedimenticolaceae bacterium]